MRKLRAWLNALRRSTCPALPGARFERPENWTETDKENFERFLKTPC
jgi:hypothetical protein